jgi:hypothetical protein
MPTANLSSAAVMRRRCRYKSKPAMTVVLGVALLAMWEKFNGDLSPSLRHYGYCDVPRSMEIYLITYYQLELAVNRDSFQASKLNILRSMNKM